MGAAAHKSGGEVGLVLSAATAAVGLYGAVVAFALGPDSPLALGPTSDNRAPVVRVAHVPAVTGLVKRGPQPSTRPERRHVDSPARHAGAQPRHEQPTPAAQQAPDTDTPAGESPTAVPPTPVTAPAPAPASAPAPTPAAPAEAETELTLPLPTVAVPTLPEAPGLLPEMPDLPLGG